MPKIANPTSKTRNGHEVDEDDDEGGPRVAHIVVVWWASQSNVYVPAIPVETLKPIVIVSRFVVGCVTTKLVDCCWPTIGLSIGCTNPSTATRIMATVNSCLKISHDQDDPVHNITLRDVLSTAYGATASYENLAQSNIVS